MTYRRDTTVSFDRRTITSQMFVPPLATDGCW
jgi:hypothetical protein